MNATERLAKSLSEKVAIDPATIVLILAAVAVNLIRLWQACSDMTPEDRLYDWALNKPARLASRLHREAVRRKVESAEAWNFADEVVRRARDKRFKATFAAVCREYR